MHSMGHAPAAVAALALGLILVPAGPAAAQDPSDLAARIEALENEIQDLKNKLKGLESAAAQAPSEERPRIKVGPGLTISSPDGKKSVQLTGRLHWDVGAYSGAEGGRLDQLDGGTNLRRGRIGVKGRYNGFSYSLSLDVGGSADDSDEVEIDEAAIYYSPSRMLKFGFGKMKIPVTFEESVSSNDISFIERSSPVDMLTDKTLGPKRVNAQMWVYGSNYLVELALHGRGDTVVGGEEGGDEELGYAGRVAFAPIRTDTSAFHLGAWADRSRAPVGSGAYWGYRVELNVADLKALRGRSRPVDSMTHWGLEAAYLNGPFWTQAEYIKGRINPRGGSSFDADGWYAQVGYVVGGTKRYDMKKGAWSVPKVGSPFPGKGMGLLELALRYSLTDLGDPANPVTGCAQNETAKEQDGFFGCDTDGTRMDFLGHEGDLLDGARLLNFVGDNLHAGKQTNITAGLNWYLNNNSRLMFNVIRVELEGAYDGNSNKTLPLVDDKFWVYGARWQFKW